MPPFCFIVYAEHFDFQREENFTNAIKMLCEERLFAAAKPKVWLRDSVKHALQNLK